MIPNQFPTTSEQNGFAAGIPPSTPDPDTAGHDDSKDDVCTGCDPRCSEHLVNASKIMIVDDEPFNIKLAVKFLRDGGFERFVTTTEPAEAMDLLLEERPGILLLDIMMPRVSGLDILTAVRSSEEVSDLPVVILTASIEEKTRVSALKLGATDFLGKPVNSTELVTRIRNTLKLRVYQECLKDYAGVLEERVMERTRELAQSQLELIRCLALAAEYRDNETGRHVIRVGRYAGVIARQLNLDPKFVQMIEHAAPLHDIGKIGVPDSILLKPGKLDPDEFDLMKRHAGFGKRVFELMPAKESELLHLHPETGSKIMNLSSSPILKVAARIALTHHEKWDGSGYPIGLAGKDIPIEGRIVAVADVFDALSTKRPYKEPFPLEKCFAIMEKERGKHFDPAALDAFFARRDEIVTIQIENADTT